MKNLLNGGLILSLLVLGSLSLKADNLLYISDTSHNVGYVDLTTDTVKVIGNTGLALNDIAFNSNGNFYGVTGTALYSLNQTTGAAGLISSFPNTIGGGQINGLVGDGANLLASSNATQKIYLLDTSPYSATALTGMVAGVSAGDLTFGSAGASGPLYDTQSNGVLDRVTISGTTITSVQVGNMGINKVVGLATIGSVTYAVAGTEIYVLDLNTAVLTPLFNYSGHGLTTVSGAAATSSLLTVPEPSNLAMLLAGISALVVYQARKRARA